LLAGKYVVVLKESDIRRIIAEVVRTVDATNLRTDSEFAESNIDSLDHWSILLALQEEFGLVVPDEDLERTTSIEKILAYVAERNA
jgi:acyl carrier protein